MISKERRAKYREAIKKFCLMDDTFMNVVFKDKDCAELLIKTIIGKDLIVTKVDTQFNIGNLYGRSVRLDILAEDKDGILYNIEVQNDRNGAAPGRARYNSSLIDANFSAKGMSWDSLPETYIIFIMRDDILGGNKPIYHIERKIEELGCKSFDDKTHIIYVNSKIRESNSLGELMSDFYCQDPKDMNNSILAERVSALKYGEKEDEDMCQIMDELIQEETEKVKEETAKETFTKSIAALMSGLGWSATEAMAKLDIPKEDYPIYFQMLGIK